MIWGPVGVHTKKPLTYSRILLGTISPNDFFSLFLFGYLIGLCSVRILGPGPYGCVRGGIQACYGSQADQSLAGHSCNFCSMLRQDILQADQIVGWRWCGWVGVQVLPLQNLLGYRRWLVQALYLLLLGILDRLIHIDSWEFPLHQVSSSPQRCSRFQLSLPVFSISILSPPEPCTSPMQTLIPMHLWYLVYFPFKVRFMCLPLNPPCYFASMGLWIIFTL